MRISSIRNQYSRVGRNILETRGRDASLGQKYDVFIFHGVCGHPNENWFQDTGDEARAGGHNVCIPQFPTPLGAEFLSNKDKDSPLYKASPDNELTNDYQTLDEWMGRAFKEMVTLQVKDEAARALAFQSIDRKEYRDVIQNYLDASRIVLVGHSLGGTLVGRIAQEFGKADAKVHATLSASPLVDYIEPEIYGKKYPLDMKTFYDGLDGALIQRGSEETHVFSGKDDDIVPHKQSKLFANMANAVFFAVNKGGHFNAKAGYTAFPVLNRVLKASLMRQPGVPQRKVRQMYNAVPALRGVSLA